MTNTNRQLGYPDDARLLILNADDFGMCHAVNEAIFRTMREGLVASTSLITPSAWSLNAMQLLKANPDLDFGVHLTIITDNPGYPYRPLTGAERVPSLVDENGYFLHLDRTDELLAQAALDEIEIEFRAQIQQVVAAGLKPTHVDWHCLHSGGRADIFELTLGLAKQYGLALRVGNQPYIEQVQSQGLPTDDYELLDSYDLDVKDKPAQYTQLLRDLPVGLTEWAVHPGLGQSELQTIEPTSWQVRQTDFDFFMSPEARDIIQQEGIILLNYAALQRLW